MTVQELREEIVQKTEEINGYLESRDADKAEEALAEKRKLQKEKNQIISPASASR
mgnify:CR=1 FL=1